MNINNFINRYAILVAVFLLVIMFALGFFSMLGDSATSDELAHISAGFSYLKFHDYRLNPEHPPLIKSLAALPLLFLNLKFPDYLSAWKNEFNSQWLLGEEFVYKVNSNPDLILILSRLPILILALILGIYLYLWTKEVFGKKVALAALFFYVFCPNIIAHARYVTTDIGITTAFFITLFYFYKFLTKRYLRYLVLAGIFLGTALITKFSSTFLIIYIIFLALIFSLCGLNKKTNEFKKTKIFPSLPLSIISIFLIAFSIIGAAYYFCSYKTPASIIHQGIEETLSPEKGPTPYKNVLHKLTDANFSRPYALYFLGLGMVQSRLAYGHTTYFLGKTGRGWRYYYPVSFLMKMPTPVIIIFLFAIVTFLKTLSFEAKPKLKYFYSNFKDWINKPRTTGNHNYGTVVQGENSLEFICWTVIATFFIIGVSSDLNIGLRHLLPIFPFLYILLAKYFFQIFYNANKTNQAKPNTNYANQIRFIIAAILLVWYLASNLLVFPHYLAYFNEWVGGYKNGYKYSVDSNLDWGQDLKRLKSWMKENQVGKIALDYFGSSVPEYYLGDKVKKWWVDRGVSDKGYFAISATRYQGSKFHPQNSEQKDYSWLDDQKPIANIGGSILVYKVE